MVRGWRQFTVWRTGGDWRVYLAVCVCFAAGAVIGGWAATGLEADTATDLQYYIRSILVAAETGNVMASIRAGAVDNLLIFGAIYLLGLTVIGAPVVLGILFVRGFALGFAAWFVLASGGMGVGVALLSFLPHNLLLLPALWVASAASLSFTVRLINRGFNHQVRVWPDFIRYTVLVGAAGLVAGTAAIVERTVTPYLLQLVLRGGA